MENTAATTGTEKIFDELRNMPCPHLGDSGVTCTLNNSRGMVSHTCKPISKAEHCPVIEALLVYIPWKREMVAEEMGMDPDEFTQYINENLYNEEDLVDNTEGDIEGSIYATDNVVILGTHMKHGYFYRITRNNDKEDYVGSFVNLINGDTLRMTESSEFIVQIHINTILKVEGMSYLEMIDHYSKDICGVDMIKNQYYTIHIDDKNKPTYTGEFLNADSMCIRMFANNIIERFFIADIVKVEPIH